METLDSLQSRRALIKGALVMAGGIGLSACTSRVAHVAAAPVPVPQQPLVPFAKPVAFQEPAFSRSPILTPQGVRPQLFRRAIAALDKHSMRIQAHDRIAIADFSIPSALPRFHIINLGTGACETLLVAHGIGSDPDHTGLLQRFSNDPGSNATCEGAFVTSDYYTGKHGASQRLEGLDESNSNALDRAIVIHGAWYSNPDMIAKWGKLGRSQGCFAVGEADLEKVFLTLGAGRMIYSTNKV
ncbi:murein L,D-transpeptidase catalytic domain family protein [Sphingomonas sp. LB-2]|uniref:murein L,D-transpeptidase catalytic domain family protein n=1 Tax=Sphingomonas caeni TaxID=2984949 RepID=UPI002231EAD0|nr:murein L,D-transpeptidase catalytic domain family protein [Sphingomonas caeni]MCW3848219.1 murein L,D-transpeptidase catalytic domain family protein [Sphingomonas caeni]